MNDDDPNDEDFTTRAQIPLTPTVSSREKRPVRPFQLNYLALLSTEPSTVKEAIDGSESKEWMMAMDEEIGSHRENDTWTMVDLPAG